MKTPEEYLENIKEKYSIGTAWQVTKPYLLEAIKQAQVDAWNEALDKAAESAITKSFKLSKYSKSPRWKLVKDEEVDLFSYDFKTEVDKQSILKLKL